MVDPGSMDGHGSPQRSAFEEAIDTYLAGLQKKPKSKKLDFIYELQASDQHHGLEGIDLSIQKLQSKCDRGKSGTKTKSILVPIINVIRDYSSIVDVFVSAHPMPAALIWGGFRVFVEFASLSLDLCEKLQEQMENLETVLRRLISYERYYYDFPGVQGTLGRSYISILDFWYQASKWCRERAFSGFRKALKAPASTVKIDKALTQLDENADRLDRLAQDAERELKYKERASQKKEALEASKRRQRDDVLRPILLLNTLREWLGGTHESSSQQYDHFKGKRHPGSCRWLLRHELFITWYAGQIRPSVLWVRGQPGAGKSVLCSAAIEEANKATSEMATAFIFLRLDRKAEPIQLLRDLSLQFLHQMFQRQQHDQDIPEFLYAALRTDRDVYANVKEMFAQLVKKLAPVYVFLDGLNEVEGDIQIPLKLLIDMASNDKVRLWCSSQYTPEVKRVLDGCHELIITTADTQNDIESYLSETVPEPATEEDPDFLTNFQKMVLKSTRGCFLWASNMIEALNTAICEDERRMLILDRLPRSMDEYYVRLVERLIKKDTSGWNLVRIVLSIVTFAQRPLQVSELREAIAILRSNLGDNISNSALPLKSKIIEYCSPLIEYIDTSADAENGQIQLSHSIVREFLKKHADQPRAVSPTLSASLIPPGKASYVSSQIIAESCLRYLMQRRYSHLLLKKTRSAFDVGSAYDLKSHHLLLYAVEFWSCHYEDVEPTEKNRMMLKAFLRLLNFHTWIQIRSLYLIGRAQRVSNPDPGQEIESVLPKWFAKTTTGKAVEAGFQELLCEWGHLLRQGILWAANGEIDRCFWGALGSTNCLSQAKEIERYSSSIFMEENASDDRCNAQYFHAVSPDARQLMLAILDTHRQADEESTGLTITLELWELDGCNGVYMEQKRLLSQVAFDGIRSLFSTHDSQSFALFPETFSSYRPAAICMSSDLHHMRVGASLFSNTTSETSTNFKGLELNTGEMIPYREEIASRDHLVALARRRVPRQESKYINDRKVVSLYDEIADPKSMKDLDENLDFSSSECGSMDAEVQSLFSEQSTGGKQSDIGVTLSDNGVPLNDDVLDPSESDLRQASESCISLSNFGSDDEASIGSASVLYNSDPSRSDPLEYEKEFQLYCAQCRSPIVVHYNCQTCTNYDICETCFDIGKWCLDAQHKLIKRMYSGQQDGEMVCFKDLAHVEELIVLDTSVPELRPLYRFTRKSEVLMFDSPPVFHPTAPLVVWLRGRDQLVFGNFEADNESIYRIPSPRSKTQRISATMRISRCGRYLHVISFETPISRRRNKKHLKSASERHESGFQPSVHLMTYRLSNCNVHEDSPTMILSVRFSLGPLTLISFSTIPFAVTWQADEAYITVSDSELKVYKVLLLPRQSNGLGKMPIPRRTTVTFDDPSENIDDQKQSGKSYVSVLRQPLLLPFSAKNRNVQFFPPSGPDRPNATVIIGPRSSSAHMISTPPIVIYLPPTSLSWTTLSDARKAEISSLTKLLGGKFEGLGPGEDLDLIRYKTIDGDLQSRAGLEDYDQTSGGGIGGHRFEIRYVQDLELAHGRERVLMRRVDVDGDGGEGNGEDGDTKVDERAEGDQEEEERRVFKTSTGAGTAVLRAGVMEERAKMSWFFDVGPALEVMENLGS